MSAILRLRRRPVGILATAALMGALLTGGALAQVSRAGAFDPFNPQAYLDSVATDDTGPALAPATQPAQTTGSPGRPIVRDPFRAAARSPFRP